MKKYNSQFLQELHGFGIFGGDSYRMRSFLFVGFFLVFGFSYTQTTGTITDTRDGKVYKTVVIGTQFWTAENLNVSTFLNGDSITEAKTNEEWKKAGEEGKPAWCYYNNDPKYGSKYGKLYNWYAVNDPRGLAPIGWRIPSKDDWMEFEKNLGKNYDNKIKSKTNWLGWEESIYCKNCENWNVEYRKKTACHVCKDNRIIGTKSVSGNGNNSLGFCALPGGRRDGYSGFVSSVNWEGHYAYWWSSSIDLENEKVHIRYLEKGWHYIGLQSSDYGDSGSGMSVRCVKN